MELWSWQTKVHFSLRPLLYQARSQFTAQMYISSNPENRPHSPRYIWLEKFYILEKSFLALYPFACFSSRGRFWRSSAISDINEKGLTFRAADAYIKSVTLAKDGELMAKLRKILTENILVNVRTHQKRALILHAYDHFNNFVMLHIEDENVFFSFNSGNKIEVRKPTFTQNHNLNTYAA